MGKTERCSWKQEMRKSVEVDLEIILSLIIIFLLLFCSLFPRAQGDFIFFRNIRLNKFESIALIKPTTA